MAALYIQRAVGRRPRLINGGNMIKVLSARTTGVALTAVLAASGVAFGAGPANASPRRICVAPAVFNTEIQWGGNQAPWHADADLGLAVQNRRTIVSQPGLQPGTALHWSGPNGSGDITIGAGNTFAGTAQFPNEGPVGYRGTLSPKRQVRCAATAVANTEIQWGGAQAPWHSDAVLSVLISNRHVVVDPTTAPAGTKVSWTSPDGNANITINAGKAFTGTAQFPNEGPVGYRGTF